MFGAKAIGNDQTEYFWPSDTSFLNSLAFLLPDLFAPGTQNDPRAELTGTKVTDMSGMTTGTSSRHSARGSFTYRLEAPEVSAGGRRSHSND
jgi:hypothetical protein